MSDREVQALDAALRRCVLDSEVAPRALDALAVRLFRHQYARCSAYRALCDRRGIRSVSGWRQVPPMPVDAYRTLDLRSFSAAETVRTFFSSGTTDTARSVHHFDSLALKLYRAASMATLRPHLLPEGGRIDVVSLIEDAAARPDSSLSQMVTWAVEELGTTASVFDPSGAALEGRTRPVLVLGTAFGLASAFEARPDMRLPPGTRIMETGGFKGRRQEVARADLHAMYARAGVEPAWVIGEYGMCELSSQWYDGVAGAASEASERRVYRPPPWARTRVLDPVGLKDVEVGEVGLLMHFDPMNRGSVQAVLTADLGERAAADERGREGFVYRGRAAGAQVRGCSLRDER